MANGKMVDKAYVLQVLSTETDALLKSAKPGNKFELASRYLADEITGEQYSDFLPT